MWTKIARIIIRKRILILIFLGLITAFMAYLVPKNQVSYDLSNLLPKTDSTAFAFQSFKEKYGSNDNIFLLLTEDSSVFEFEKFRKLQQFTREIKKIQGVDSVFGITNFPYLKKNSEEKKFELIPDDTSLVKNQAEVNEIKELLYNQLFFDNILYVKDSNVTVLAIIMNPDTLMSGKRNKYVLNLATKVKEFTAESGIEFGFTGMPYVRSKISNQVESEIYILLTLAILLTAIILFFFLKSPTAVAISLFVVILAVIWSLGINVLLGYKITVLIGLIPPLIIVIGIPNCIFLLNKYFAEYKSHHNQARSLSRVIRKTGNATLMTNATTAAGFATFALTPSILLQEFGIVASLSIFCVFILSILIIPILYSFLPPPTEKQYKHLESKRIVKIINGLINISQNYRGTVYVSVIFIAGIAGFGLSKLNNDALIVDDIQDNDPVLIDMKSYEKNFNGIVPFEIIIDTQKKGRATKLKTLQKLEEVYELLAEYDEFAKPLSILDVIKYSTQAFYNGDPTEYRLPLKNEMGFIFDYASRSFSGNSSNLLKKVMDEERREIRISLQMRDVGSKRTKELMSELDKKIQKIFEETDYTFYYTGISVIVAKGVDMLVTNLIFTLLLAIALISLIMAIMFRNLRMVVISIIPNLLPLVITGAIMGYFGINIKPSTILVFSIAFGISVDDTIHFLAKYRQELTRLNGNIKQAVLVALKETGVSMFYTSVVLFFGFGIFIVSNFGGTQALGVLVSFTLLVAMFSNLILLPCLLLSLDKLISIKADKNALLEEELIDEEEDFFEDFDEENK